MVTVGKFDVQITVTSPGGTGMCFFDNVSAFKLVASPFPQEDTTTLPALAAGSPGLRAFVLIPSDDPLPFDLQLPPAVSVIQNRWNICINWLMDSINTGVRAYPNVVFLNMPFTKAQVLAQTQPGGNLSDFIFDWMEFSTIWKPRSRPLVPEESWLVMVRGAGGFAGGLDVNSNAENVGWGIVGDVVISAWLSGDAGLEPNRCSLILGSSFPCSASAQTGTAVHEMMHGAFAAVHVPSNVDSIMRNWEDFPNVPIDQTNRDLMDGSPYIIGDIGEPPGPGSVITDITFNAGTHKERAGESDNWNTTWSNDNHQYTAWGDGGGFGGGATAETGRVGLGVGRVEGTKGNYQNANGGRGGFNVNGGFQPENPNTNWGTSGNNAKSYGIISIFGNLYMWVMPGSGATSFSNARIWKSTNKGATWSQANWNFTQNENVMMPTFLQQGQNHGANTDGFVYT